MIEIKGYALIGRYVGKLLGAEEILFGRNGNAFSLSELHPELFLNRDEAEKFREIILNSFRLESISLVYIKMSVIESKEEWEQVKEEWQKTKSIIVIEVIDDPYWHETRMYGRIIRDENGQIDRTKLWDYKAGGARLRDNGFEPFEDIKSAEDCARELTRQDESYVLFATFSLKRL